jgi:hypothetical protein
MPLHLKLLNLDEVFARAKTPIIINELPNLTTEDRERFTSLVRETYTSDMVSVMPKCACPGDEGLRGEHLVGEICDICNTVVKQSIEDDIVPTLWFRKPKGVKALMNPIVWIMLNARFSKSKFRILQWLTDRHYGSNSGLKTPEVVYKLTAQGIPRGYNAFIENFDEIMGYLFSLKDFRDKKGATKSIIDMLGITHPSKDPLRQLIEDHRDSIFCDHIPLLNKTLLVIERTAMGYDYGESTMFSMVNVTNTMLSIDRDYHDKNPLSVENRTARIHAMLGDYYIDFFKKNVAPKEGLIRQQVYSGRGNHGFRAVITSHEGLHDHDEIHIPWCVAVTVWRQHILNRLMSNTHPCGGYTHNKAVNLLMSHVYKYHPHLDQIFREFISKSENGRGPACLSQRNRPGCLL